MRTTGLTIAGSAVPLILLFGSLLTHANAAQVLTFEGLQDNEDILEFYNGGTGSLGSGPGPNYGISFTPGGRGIIDLDAGGDGNFANEPTPDTAAYFLSGTLLMNVPAGFTSGFSFFYSTTPFDSGVVTVYDGLNATGTLLASVFLDPTICCTGGDPTGDFNTWLPVGVAFSGTAKSVDFAGAANAIGFDNITLGAAVPIIPEPSTIALIVVGVSATLGRLWRRPAR